MTRSYEHLVGAYGVVGFSGVKDARESVVAADALRRLANRRLVITRELITGQRLDRNWTNTGRLLDKHWTFARPTDARCRCLTARNLKY